MNRLVRELLLVILLVAALSMGGVAEAQKTMEDVRKRGHLLCGVSEGLVGFSEKTSGGGWQGFDVDFCRAVAAAIFESGTKTQFVPLSATTRFSALQGKEIDVLSRNTTWTLTRDVTLELDFAGVSYFDVQALMVPNKSGFKSAKDLEGKSICLLEGTTHEQNVLKFLDANRINAQLLLSDTRTGARQSYDRGLCQAYASDLSALSAERSELSDPDGHSFLPDVVAKEPLGPAVRDSDSSWREVVRWVLFLLINAEEAGWTSEQAKTENLVPKLVVPPEVTGRLNLPQGWARRVIAEVGNYGEIYERNIGKDSKLKLSRGLNALWTNGGILFAPPFR